MKIARHKNTHQVGTTIVAGVLKPPNSKLPTDYIRKYLIKEIGEIVENHQELSWVLMMAGVELLGRCEKENFTDREDWKYFRAGLALFKFEYQAHNTQHAKFDLYENLRCGLAHMTFPKENIIISETKNGGEHLSIVDGKLVLVAEDFFNDFKIACENVITMIETGERKLGFFVIPV